jgi:hypothetical protein
VQALINDPGVAKYRQYEIEEASRIVEELLKDKPDVAFIHGALFLLKKLLQMPRKFAKSKESQEMANNMIKRDMKDFTSKYMHLFLEKD